MERFEVDGPVPFVPRPAFDGKRLADALVELENALVDLLEVRRAL